MTRATGSRLPLRTFWHDPRTREGYHSDDYFRNWRTVLEALAQRGVTFDPKSLAEDLPFAREKWRLEPYLDLPPYPVGDVEVEMQVFTRRRPFSVVVGVDEALALLRRNTGYFDEEGRWVDCHRRLEVWACHDGDILPYDGDPERVTPCLRIRGPYRYFAHLETPILGVLSDPTRVATNVYEALVAARGKGFLFFPARFHHPLLQSVFGYAHRVAVETYNRTHGERQEAVISTEAQGSWWGGQAAGTIAHAAIACFLGDTPAAVLAFAEHMPLTVPRIALVDFHNDAVGTSLAVVRKLLLRYIESLERGEEHPERFILHGVRIDTSSSLRDVSVEPLGQKELDLGVTPRLVHKVRAAIDSAWEHIDLPHPERYRPLAQEYCRRIRISVTGGFTAEKIRLFEQLGVPVDNYGVGSSLLENHAPSGRNNDFTADVVRVKVGDQWVECAKVGRRACDNPNLERIDWDAYDASQPPG